LINSQRPFKFIAKHANKFPILNLKKRNLVCKFVAV
jgi:hypothetical protein